MTTSRKQVAILMKEKSKGSLNRACKKSGVTEKTARKYIKLNGQELGPKKPRDYSTCKDPFENHWPEITQMLENAPSLEAWIILEYLQDKYPGVYKNGQLRTLQRRLATWSSESGPSKMCYFATLYTPGRQSQSDCTHMNSLHITLKGVPFSHMLFHFILSYSRYETIMICQTETFDAITKGFAQAVREIGGICKEHRTDNLTAATQASGDSRVFTERWRSFTDHYKVTPTRNNPGESQENGKVEKSHDLFKKEVDQRLLLRGSRDFRSEEEYWAFLVKIKDKRNAKHSERFAEEQQQLGKLPEKDFFEATLLCVRVSPYSIVSILGVQYSVPTRLIGCGLKAYVYLDKLELFLGRTLVLSLPRLEEGVLFDYRHVIDVLIRKPGAFEHYQYRAYAYPNLSFRRAYDAFMAVGVDVSKRYLELLYLAKMEGEQDVTAAIDLILDETGLPLKPEVVALISTFRKTTQAVIITQPLLETYDELLMMSYLPKESCNAESTL